ncbi:hypothetical protein TNCV_4250581 [Trichonephila clavipes]|nr:hypothetical protein TNCV_4250581 [Trichonephila clavipes]
MAIGDGPSSFVSQSKDEEVIGTLSPNFHTTPEIRQLIFVRSNVQQEATERVDNVTRSRIRHSKTPTMSP